MAKFNGGEIPKEIIEADNRKILETEGVKLEGDVFTAVRKLYRGLKKSGGHHEKFLLTLYNPKNLQDDHSIDVNQSHTCCLKFYGDFALLYDVSLDTPFIIKGEGEIQKMLTDWTHEFCVEKYGLKKDDLHIKISRFPKKKIPKTLEKAKQVKESERMKKKVDKAEKLEKQQTFTYKLRLDDIPKKFRNIGKIKAQLGLTLRERMIYPWGEPDDQKMMQDIIAKVEQEDVPGACGVYSYIVYKSKGVPCMTEEKVLQEVIRLGKIQYSSNEPKPLVAKKILRADGRKSHQTYRLPYEDDFVDLLKTFYQGNKSKNIPHYNVVIAMYNNKGDKGHAACLKRYGNMYLLFDSNFPSPIVFNGDDELREGMEQWINRMGVQLMKLSKDDIRIRLKWAPISKPRKLFNFIKRLIPGKRLISKFFFFKKEPVDVVSAA